MADETTCNKLETTEALTPTGDPGAQEDATGARCAELEAAVASLRRELAEEVRLRKSAEGRLAIQRLMVKGLSAELRKAQDATVRWGVLGAIGGHVATRVLR